MAQRTFYKWAINNFLKIASRDDPDLTLDSKRFTLTGTNFKFHLRFRPTNKQEYGSKEYCSAILILSDLDEAKSVYLFYKLWIENTDGDKIAERSGLKTGTFDKIGRGFVYNEFVHHDELYSPESTFIKHDIVFICCEIRFRSSIPRDIPSHLATQLGEKEWSLYEEGFTGSCTIEVADQKFEVEKRLMAHSIVFDRMFKSGMKEAQTGTIILNDTTPVIIKAFVKYLHVQNIEDSAEKALGLYFLADKYEIVDLKRKCARTLIEHLDLDNILDRLIMAFQHNDMVLKRGVLYYLDDRPEVFKEIMKSIEWANFVIRDMQLSSEIIDEVFGSMNWY